MLSNTLRLNFCYLKIIYTIHPYCNPKIIVHILILKNKQKNRCVCIQKIIRLVIKMEMKMKDIPHRDDMNRPKSGHGHKYSKYKKCLSMMMMLICTNQHLRNIRSSIHESWAKLRLNWKNHCLKKTCVTFSYCVNERIAQFLGPTINRIRHRSVWTRSNSTIFYLRFFYWNILKFKYACWKWWFLWKIIRKRKEKREKSKTQDTKLEKLFKKESCTLRKNW